MADREMNSVAWPGMTVEDASRMQEINALNGWGITVQELRELVDQHREARATGDTRTMSMIVFRLEDINFHTIAGLLDDGKYDEAVNEIYYGY